MMWQPLRAGCLCCITPAGRCSPQTEAQVYVPAPGASSPRHGFGVWDPPLLGQFLLLDLSLDCLHVFATMSTADVDGSVQMTLFFPSEAEALL